MPITNVYRDGNLSDINDAGSLHEFLVDLHERFGPIASFWWGKQYTVSIASPDLFKEHQHVFDRPRKFFLLNKLYIERKRRQTDFTDYHTISITYSFSMYHSTS